MKVSIRLYFAIFLQFIIAISLIVLVLNMQQKQKHDSLGINLAGRQRMLSQKMTKEILLFSQDLIIAEKVANTIRVFDLTLKGLADGGKVPLDLAQAKFADLPKNESREALAQLKKVETLWKSFRANADTFLKEKSADSLDYVNKNNVPLLQEMNKAVFIMDNDASEKVRSMKKVLKWGIVVLGVLFLAALIIVRKNVQIIFNLLGKLGGGLSTASEKTWESAGVVSATSLQLAEGSSEQAAAIEETSASLEEMSSMTKQNADNANHADALVKETDQIVAAANDAMSRLTVSMEDISKASEETSNIIKTIDEIAFQTNLLALNAAVEAARAGEAGAGFAVVADEVRNLALRAAGAAKNTSTMIEETTNKIKAGTGLVLDTNESFKNVTKGSLKVADLVGEIAAASNEQAQGIEQVNIAVAEMEKVTQQNAASSEEAASASEELMGQADQMKGFVQELEVLIGAGGNQTGKKNMAGPLGLENPEYAVFSHEEHKTIR
jgi:methyl-accepting chemotaxis protein